MKSLVEIVGAKPKPWWPEGVEYLEDCKSWTTWLEGSIAAVGRSHRVFISDVPACLMFEASCVRWLAKDASTGVYVQRLDDQQCVTLYDMDGNSATFKSPDLLVTLIATCMAMAMTS